MMCGQNGRFGHERSETIASPSIRIRTVLRLDHLIRYRSKPRLFFFTFAVVICAAEAT